MDWAVDGLRKALALIAQYPDVLSLIAGTLIGFTFTTMIERYFLPQYTGPNDRRQQQGLTFILCWGASSYASAVLWALIDPKDSPRFRITVSVLVGVLSFPGYPLIAKVVTGLWPRLGSAWASPPKPPQ